MGCQIGGISTIDKSKIHFKVGFLNLFCFFKIHRTFDAFSTQLLISDFGVLDGYFETFLNYVRF